MPPVQLTDTPPAEAGAATIATFATKADGTADPGADAQALADAAGIALGEELEAIRFDGDAGAVARVPLRGEGSSILLVVGLGPADKVDAEALRVGAGNAARAAAKDSVLSIVVPGDLGDLDAAAAGRAVAEGAALGAYAFTTYRTKQQDVPSLERIQVHAGQGLDAEAVGRGVERGSVIAAAVATCRDLVNTPPQDKRPPALAERIAELADAAGLRAEIRDESWLAEERFGGVLGVGQGSSERPRVVELTWEPEGAAGHVVLCGKGITFDSGGLSLKPSAAMQTMKLDMAGAATVVAAMTTLRDLGVRTKVTGLVALAENMPSGTAIRVSDVLTHRNGKTVEVMNTDAEGRLVLADVLAYGAEMEPDAMIDLATLTGAQIVALGGKIAGLLGTDDDLVEALRDAAGAAGERVWPLPLPADYAEALKSPVADLKNIGKAGEAGTIVAALFLKAFTDGVAWAHLDIAGPSFTEEGDAGYTARGATGMGVRTIVQYLLDRQA